MDRCGGCAADRFCACGGLTYTPDNADFFRSPAPTVILSIENAMMMSPQLAADTNHMRSRILSVHSIINNVYKPNKHCHSEHRRCEESYQQVTS